MPFKQNNVFQKKTYTPKDSRLEPEIFNHPFGKEESDEPNLHQPRPSDRRMPKAGKGYGWNPGKLTSWGWLVADIYHYLQGLINIPGFLNHQQLVLGMAHMQRFYFLGGWRFAISEVVSAGHGLQVS